MSTPVVYFGCAKIKDRTHSYSCTVVQVCQGRLQHGVCHVSLALSLCANVTGETCCCFVAVCGLQCFAEVKLFSQCCVFSSIIVIVVVMCIEKRRPYAV